MMLIQNYIHIIVSKMKFINLLSLIFINVHIILKYLYNLLHDNNDYDSNIINNNLLNVLVNLDLKYSIYQTDIKYDVLNDINYLNDFI